MGAHDLNCDRISGDIAVDECGQDGLFPGDGARASLGVSTSGTSAGSQRWASTVFGLGSLPRAGVRADDFSRESARYRSVSEHAARDELPSRFPSAGHAQYAGAGERATSLASVRRAGPPVDRPCTPPLSRRAQRPRSRCSGVCGGLHAHRSEPGAVPLGKLDGDRCGGEAARLARPARAACRRLSR